MLGFRPLATNALTVNHAFRRENGSLSLTLDGVSVSIFGVAVHTGSVSVSLADIQVTASGSIVRSGSLSVALDPLSFVATGSDVHAGPLSIQLDGLTASLNGVVTQNGVLALPLQDITPAFIGEITRNGTATIALADLSVQMTGQHGEVDDFWVVLADLSFDASGIVVPPGPVQVVTRGGIDDYKKHKNFRNQKDETERDIQKAVNKVFGIEEPSEVEPVEETVAEASPPDFSAQIERLALEAEAKALGQTIEQYQAMLDSERDDEEALLLLL